MVCIKKELKRNKSITETVGILKKDRKDYYISRYK